MNIVSFSGGKDSTAMLLMMIEKGIRVDKVINIDTTKEFPAMYRHIEKVQSMIPIEIEIIKIDFDYWFSEHILTKEINKGQKGYGWPTFRFRWCTGLKKEIFRTILSGQNYNPKKRQKINNKQIEGKQIFIGFSLEEKKRPKKDTKLNETYPLIKWQITGKQALEYCYNKGLNWEGLYEKFQRVSCWCCPLSRIKELEIIFNEFPELWKKLEEMDKKTPRKFRYAYTLKQLTAKFQHKKSVPKLNFN